MQASLFKIFAITAAFSTVLSAPVDPAEGQVNTTETTDLHAEATPVNVAEVKETEAGDVTIQQKCPRDTAPHISTREKHGDIFERSCREYTCHADWQCIKWGCLECNLYFRPCGESYTRCY